MGWRCTPATVVVVARGATAFVESAVGSAAVVCRVVLVVVLSVVEVVIVAVALAMVTSGAKIGMLVAAPRLVTVMWAESSI